MLRIQPINFLRLSIECQRNRQTVTLKHSLSILTTQVCPFDFRIRASIRPEDVSGFGIDDNGSRLIEPRFHQSDVTVAIEGYHSHDVKHSVGEVDISADPIVGDVNRKTQAGGNCSLMRRIADEDATSVGVRPNEFFRFGRVIDAVRGEIAAEETFDRRNDVFAAIHVDAANLRSLGNEQKLVGQR